MKANKRELIRAMQQQACDEMEEGFISLGQGGHYTNAQKEYAIGLIDEYGIREGPQHEYYHCLSGPCKGGAGYMV